mmetsp:Transcript_4798/g.19192  ORF Transcript_4798/g.19192 Transcript_4798/m.19192 type:complete len:150 (-) Transcript_4798:87-536(-)
MTDYVIRTRRAGVSGVDSVHRLPIKQEMPPSGGYPAVRFSRSMPNAGPSGALLMAGAFTLFCYGMYRQKAATEVWWTKKQERYFNRMVTAPVLQAYEDKEFLERQSMWDAWERFKMKDVKGWKMNDSWLKTSPRYLAPEHRFDTYSGGT